MMYYSDYIKGWDHRYPFFAWRKKTRVFIFLVRKTPPRKCSGSGLKNYQKTHWGIEDH